MYSSTTLAIVASVVFFCVGYDYGRDDVFKTRPVQHCQGNK